MVLIKIPLSMFALLLGTALFLVFWLFEALSNIVFDFDWNWSTPVIEWAWKDVVIGWLWEPMGGAYLVCGILTWIGALWILDFVKSRL